MDREKKKNNGNPQKSPGLINQTDTAEMIICYPLNDLKYNSRVSGQPRLGAERVSGLLFNNIHYENKEL